MLDKNDRKRTIWVYAVVLFMSAFIVLLITMYSQIKFNNSFKSLKSSSIKNKEKVGKYKLNLSSAVKENERLTAELQENKKKLEAANKQIENLLKDNLSEKGVNTPSYINYEYLLDANNKYLEKNYVEATNILKNKIDLSLLGTNGTKFYDNLLSIVESKAISILYKAGKNYVSSEEFDKAIESFSLCYSMAAKSDYADDCLYFLGFCEYKLNKKEDALMYLNKLESDHPGSPCISDARAIKEQIVASN